MNIQWLQNHTIDNYWFVGDSLNNNDMLSAQAIYAKGGATFYIVQSPCSYVGILFAQVCDVRVTRPFIFYKWLAVPD